MKTRASHILVFLAGAAAGWGLAKYKAPQWQIDETVSLTDTIVLRDTIRIPHPMRTSEVIVRTDTLRIASAAESDTAGIPLPISQVHYADTLAEVWVSGYRPQLDSLHIYPVTKSVTQSITRTLTPADRGPSRWHLGITAGITASTAGISPGITVGISYTILDF